MELIVLPFSTAWREAGFYVCPVMRSLRLFVSNKCPSEANAHAEPHVTCSFETAFINGATACDPAFHGNSLVIFEYVEDKLMRGKIQDGCLSTGKKIQKSSSAAHHCQRIC